MRRNLSHIIAATFNEPLLLEPAYARVFFCTLGREMGAAGLSVPQQQVQFDTPGVLAETDEYMAGGKRPARVYRVVNSIAILPVTGTLVHRLSDMRSFSGMTGYDGIIARLRQAITDNQVRGVLLGIDSPGGQAAGAFDYADMICRLRQRKPVWVLCNDTTCSVAVLLASAYSRRLATQISRIDSIDMMMNHISYTSHLTRASVDITLIYSGAHKMDGNQFEALPTEVRQDVQRRIDTARRVFAERVMMYTGLSVDVVTGTEAAAFGGQPGIEAGLADGLINASDAISVITTALNNNVRGGTIPQLTATEAATQENQRVIGILTCQGAKGCEQLATMLVGQQSMSVKQARAVLAAATPQQPVASTQSEADRIMVCEEANGRERLTAALATMPKMAMEKARPILAASPQADAGPSLCDQTAALDEAKGAEAQAEQLAACPRMTVESARAMPAAGSGKAEPVSVSTTAMFEHLMTNHSPAAVQGGMTRTSADGDTSVKMLMTMPWSQCWPSVGGFYNMVTKTITEQRAEVCILAGNDPAHTTTGSSGISSPTPALTPLMLDEATGKLVVWDGQKTGSAVSIPVLPLENTETALAYYKSGTFATETIHQPESVDEHRRANIFAGSILSHAALP